MAEIHAFRTRYPVRAVLAVAGAASLALVELALLSIWLMPLVPLVPVFIMIMIGNACVLSAALSYATSLARREPVTTARAEGQTKTLPSNTEALAESSRAA
ncbi:MAG TPA: hypothetical protein VFZ53_08495 [Polyangiaceae bacterium]